MLIPRELRIRRAQLGLTQAQLAAQVGVRPNTVARWERGELSPAYPERVLDLLLRLERAGNELHTPDVRTRRRRGQDRGSRNPLAVPNNLPALPTSFVGRLREVAEVYRLLHATRLLCLLGPGGIGKTRLAIEAAARVATEYPDGVWFTDLAVVVDEDHVAESVAHGLGVVERPDQSLIETLVYVISEWRVLLVFDNCEQVLPACADLARRLLGRCASLTVLATSRESLRIGGETIWRVPPLSMPRSTEDTASHDSRESISDSEQLFVERARTAAPGFSLTDHLRSSVARLCNRLQGLPLAIELAAAQVSTQPVERLADAVIDAHQPTTPGATLVVPPAQTLRVTLAWSYDLLPRAERVLLQRLSVFAGGWTNEAAEAVCRGPGENDRGAVARLLPRLMDKTLVAVQTTITGNSRHQLLDSVRQFGTEQLHQSREWHQIKDRHAGWYLSQAEIASEAIFGWGQSVWFRWFDIELDNVRAALDWTVESGDAATGLRLSARLQHLWLQGGRLREGLARIEALLALPHAAGDTSARGAALVTAGHLSRQMGDPAAGRLYAEQGLALARELQNPLLLFEATRQLGQALLPVGEFEAAESLFTESLEIAREIGQSQIARALGGLGFAWMFGRDYARARALLEESVAQLRGLGDDLNLGMYLCLLADVDLREGRLDAARARARDALAHTHSAPNWGRVLDVFIRLAEAERNPEEVLRLGAILAELRPYIGLSALNSPRVVERAKNELGESRADAAWRSGQAVVQIRAFASVPAHRPGAWWMGPELLIQMLGNGSLLNDRSDERQPGDDTARLTRRELQVLRLVAEGKGNRDISSTLTLSVRTVERHVANVYTKIDAHSRVEAAAYALRRGLA